MNDNIEKFVSDMRKVVAFEKQHGKLEYTQQMNPGKLVLDAIENDLIKSSLDLVYICNELPELSYEICRYFDTYIFRKVKRHKQGVRKLKRLVEKEEKEKIK